MNYRPNPYRNALAWLLVLVFLPRLASEAPAASGSQGARPTPRPAAQKGVIARNPYIGAIVVEAATGRVLLEDNADARGYPASMLKMMTLLVVLERIEQKQLSLQDQVPVSARAAGMGGSQVWLAEKESFSVDEMLYALMVQSANDAAMALAEKVAGSSEAFVELMNRRARELGMASTVFQSPHGLPPSPGQQHDVTTPRDFARLSRALVRKPDALRYTSTREHTFRPNASKGKVIMRTHNHLLASVPGCDGLKTGFFTQAGYSVAATAARQGQRVIVVVLGSSDWKVRDARAADLIAKGFDMLSTAGKETAIPKPGSNARKPAIPAS